MRGVLVLFGLLLAALVAFVVAWPRLVDEPALRAELARVLADAGGTELRIDGAVRLELLPSPRLAIEGAVLGSRSEPGQDTRFTADRIDVELAPLALLAGRLEPRGLQLVRPYLMLAGSAEILAAPVLRALTTGELAGIGRLQIVDGTLLRGGDRAWPPPIEAIDLRGERDSAGAFQMELAAAVAGDPVRLTLEGEPLTPDVPVHLDVRLEAGPRASPAILEFAGSLTPQANSVAAAGTTHLNTERGPLPAWLGGSVAAAAPAFDLRARLADARSRLELSDLELAVGDGRLRGAFVLSRDPAPAFDLSLEGASLTGTSELVEAGRKLLLAAKAGGPLAGRIGLRLGKVAWHGDQVRGLRAELVLSPGAGLDLRQLQAVLPGETALSWTGSGPTAGDAPLVGQLSLQAAELRRLLRWLGVAAEDLPEGGLTSLDLTGSATLAPDRLRLTGLQARVDATQLKGAADLALEPRPRLDLTLAANRVNTALYIAPPVAYASWGGRLDALDGSLDLTVDQLSYDVLRGQGFRLRAALDAGQLDLKELRIADLARASLDLRGAADLSLGAYDIAGDLAMPDPKPIFRLLRFEPSLGIDRLAPLRLHGQSRREAGSTSVDLHLTATGIDATLTGRLDGPFDTGALDLALTLGARDAGELLLAFGWPAPPDQPLHGPVDARLKVTRAGGPVELDLQASAAGSEIAGELSWSTDGPRPRLAGALRAPLLATTLAAALYDTLALPLDFPPGRPWLWPGVWPRQPLRWGWLLACDVDLAVDVAKLRHQRRELPGAGAALRLRDGRLALTRLHAPVGGGTLEGQITLDGKSGYAQLATDLRLEGAQADTLAALLAPGSGLRGRLDLAAKVEAQGRSIAELVGSLAGTGSVALHDGRLPEVELGRASGSDAGATPSLEGASLQGPLRVGNGIATSLDPGLALAFADGGGDVSFHFDLLAWILDASIEVGGLAMR
ncbi:MAG: AsmA family protein, partial [Geminicoccaceae bacterium]